MSRILSVDGNKKQLFHHSEHDGQSAVETITDVDPLLRHVKKMKYLQGSKKSEVTNYVGSVDMDLFVDWCRKKHIDVGEGMRDNKYLVMYLNDPGNSKFKAVNGKI